MYESFSEKLFHFSARECRLLDSWRHNDAEPEWSLKRVAGVAADFENELVRNSERKHGRVEVAIAEGLSVLPENGSEFRVLAANTGRSFAQMPDSLFKMIKCNRGRHGCTVPRLPDHGNTKSCGGRCSVSYARSMRFVVTVAHGFERGPQAWSQGLTAILQSNPRGLPISFGFERTGRQTRLTIDYPPELRAVVESQLYAAYPEAQIEPCDEVAVEEDKGQHTWSASVRLIPDVHPLRGQARFIDNLDRSLADPLAGVLAMLSGGGPARSSCVILTLHPASHRRRKHAERHLARWMHLRGQSLRFADWWIRAISSRSLRVQTVASLAVIVLRLLARTRSDSASDEQASAGTERLHGPLFEVLLRVDVTAPTDRAEEAAQKLREIAGAFAPFTEPGRSEFAVEPTRRRSRTFLLAPSEAALLWHPPMETARPPGLRDAPYREREWPLDLPTPKTDHSVTVLGRAVFRGRSVKCGLLPDDRRRHLLLLGKTGMGKSTLLQQLITADIAAGRGVALIDPHGDLCEAVLQSIPRHRTNDVILFDATDRLHPVAFNVLQCERPSDRPLVASAVLSAFKKLYGDSWGPRLEHILRNCLLLLLEHPGTTLVSIQQLLTDGRFRQQLVNRSRDPVVRQFWEGEFAAMPERLRGEAISPVLNKVGHFASNPILRAIVGQPQSRLNLRRIMDDGKVLLCNFSKGRLGDDASTLLGSFLITAIQLAAMSRADLPETKRRDFFLTVDEFGSFATDSFAAILSEARKYRLNLTLANQYLAQMSEGTLAAVFGNVGSLLVFQVGAQDADTLCEQLGQDITPEDILNIPRFHCVSRLLIDGQPSRPFVIQTLLPSQQKLDPNRAEIIQRVSRRMLSPQHCGSTMTLRQVDVRHL